MWKEREGPNPGSLHLYSVILLSALQDSSGWHPGFCWVMTLVNLVKSGIDELTAKPSHLVFSSGTVHSCFFFPVRTFVEIQALTSKWDFSEQNFLKFISYNFKKIWVLMTNLQKVLETFSFLLVFYRLYVKSLFACRGETSGFC